MQFGFTFTETTEGLQIPHCMFCNAVFSNANLKPSELQHLFNNRHGEANDLSHEIESLKAKRIRFESRGTLPKLVFFSANKLLLIASIYGILQLLII